MRPSPGDPSNKAGQGSPREARAGQPAPPPLSRAATQAEGDRAAYQRMREGQERRSMLRGLILLAILVGLIALLHHGMGRAFPTGWWRQW